MKIVVITGDEPRHTFFRLFLSNQEGLELLYSFVEEKSQQIRNLNKEKVDVTNHLNEREAIEKDFFGLYNNNCSDKSNVKNLDSGQVNSESIINQIIKLNPDYILTYGCSIIKPPLINKFEKRIVNMHLGLSPYYRGSGTNIFPIYNDELQFIGTTFMFMDKGIDTGPIIHQIRAKILPNDSHHQIGNRLIRDSIITIPRLLKYLNKNSKLNSLTTNVEFNENPRRHYKRNDFNDEIITTIEKKVSNGIIKKYLINKENLFDDYPIISAF